MTSKQIEKICILEIPNLLVMIYSLIIIEYEL